MVVELGGSGLVSVGTPAQQRGAVLRQPVVTEQRKRRRSAGGSQRRVTPSTPSVPDEDFVGPPSPEPAETERLRQQQVIQQQEVQERLRQKTILDIIQEKRQQEFEERTRQSIRPSPFPRIIEQKARPGLGRRLQEKPLGVKVVETIENVSSSVAKPFARGDTRLGKLTQAPFIFIEKRTGEPVKESLRKAGQVSKAVSKIPVEIKGVPIKVTTPFIPVPTQLQPTLRRGRDISFELGLTSGVVETVREKPLSSVAIPLALGFGTGASLKALSSIPGKAGKIVPQVVGGSLGGSFVFFEGGRLASQPDKFTLGEESAKSAIELIAFGEGAKLGGKTVGLTTDIIKTRTPTRALDERIGFREVQRIIKTPSGKLDVASTFALKAEKAPPKLVTETTKARELLGIKPITEKIIPPKEILITPKPGVVIGDRPFPVIEKIVGSKKLKFIGIGGVTDRIDLASARRLSRVDKGLLQDVLSREKGFPVNIGIVDKIVTPEAKFFLSDITSKKLFQATPDKISTLGKLGERTSLTRAVSKIEPKLTSEIIDTFKVDIALKDISKPFARDVGRSREVTGFIIRSKNVKDFSVQPKVDTFGKDLDSFGNVQAQKLKQPEVKVQNLKEIIGSIVSLPKFKTPKPTTQIIKSPTLKTLPATKVQTISPFAVTKTRGKIKTLQVQPQKVKTLQLSKLSTVQLNEPKVKAVTKVRQISKQLPQQKFKQDVSQLQKFKLKQPQLQKVIISPQLLKFKTPGRFTQFEPAEFKLPKTGLPEIPKTVGKLKKKKKKGDRFLDDLAFIEGFTAKTLGLKPIVIKEADIQKIKQTPLGIRRGIIIK